MNKEELTTSDATRLKDEIQQIDIALSKADPGQHKYINSLLDERARISRVITEGIPDDNPTPFSALHEADLDNARTQLEIAIESYIALSQQDNRTDFEIAQELEEITQNAGINLHILPNNL